MLIKFQRNTWLNLKLTCNAVDFFHSSKTVLKNLFFTPSFPWTGDNFELTEMMLNRRQYSHFIWRGLYLNWNLNDSIVLTILISTYSINDLGCVRLLLIQYKLSIYELFIPQKSLNAKSYWRQIRDNLGIIHVNSLTM